MSNCPVCVQSSKTLHRVDPVKEISIDDYLIEEKEEIKDKKREKKRHKSISSKALETKSTAQMRNSLASYKKKVKSMNKLMKK